MTSHIGIWILTQINSTTWQRVEMMATAVSGMCEIHQNLLLPRLIILTGKLEQLLTHISVLKQ
jgi:hypothetical protein